MKVVLDTNIIVSAFLKPRSKPARILRLILQGDLFIICNEHILAEYLEVLKRPKFELNLRRVRTILTFIRSRGIHAPALPHSLDLPHHDDEPFLEATLSAGADALVTGNTRHFPENACKGICVLTPDEFLQTLPPPLSVP
ncbi:MAG: putative toxin-antitoxin system toxin component, PIN family [Deltaproteobacteria bacterium]|nr:putative toxin-antitoxin system toxin component, PIN family [Deltaproteobacteria bacterium]